MEESKDLITGYKIFRSLVYVSLVLEFFLSPTGISSGARSLPC